ncbi:hypothetical protein T484DRAFT_1767100 [Baffinella frigidus]|nr:hypothetical protein T484DRAFT_1767100 [Cryptophyta sp. CCMP2293]
MSEEAARLEDELRESKGTASELTASVEVLEAQRTAMSEETARLEGELRQSKGAASELTASVEVLEAQRTAMSEEAARLEGELRQSKGAASELTASVEALETQRKTMSEEAARLEGELSQSKGASSEFTASVASLEAQMKAAKEKAEAAHEEIHIAVSFADEAHAETDKVRAELTMVEEKVVEMQRALDAAGEEQAGVVQAVVVAAQAHAEQAEVVNALRKSLEALGEERGGALARAAALETELQGAVGELTSVGAALKEVQAAVDDNTGQVARLEMELSGANERGEASRREAEEQAGAAEKLRGALTLAEHARVEQERAVAAERGAAEARKAGAAAEATAALEEVNARGAAELAETAGGGAGRVEGRAHAGQEEEGSALRTSRGGLGEERGCGVADVREGVSQVIAGMVGQAVAFLGAAAMAGEESNRARRDAARASSALLAADQRADALGVQLAETTQLVQSLQEACEEARRDAEQALAAQAAALAERDALTARFREGADDAGRALQEHARSELAREKTRGKAELGKEREAREDARVAHVGEVAELRVSVSFANAELDVLRQELERARREVAASLLAADALAETVELLKEGCQEARRDKQSLTAQALAAQLAGQALAAQLAERTKLVESLQAASDAATRDRDQTVARAGALAAEQKEYADAQEALLSAIKRDLDELRATVDALKGELELTQQARDAAVGQAARHTSHLSFPFYEKMASLLEENAEAKLFLEAQARASGVSQVVAGMLGQTAAALGAAAIMGDAGMAGKAMAREKRQEAASEAAGGELVLAKRRVDVLEGEAALVAKAHAEELAATRASVASLSKEVLHATAHIFQTASETHAEVLSELRDDLKELLDEIAEREEEPSAAASSCLPAARAGLEASIKATGAELERAREEIGQAGAMLNAALERVAAWKETTHATEVSEEFERVQSVASEAHGREVQGLKEAHVADAAAIKEGKEMMFSLGNTLKALKMQRDQEQATQSSTVASLDKSLEDYEGKIATLTRDLDHAIASLDESAATNARVQSELTRTQDDLARAEQEVKRVRQSAEDGKAQGASERKTSRAQVAELREQRATLEEGLSKATELVQKTLEDRRMREALSKEAMQELESVKEGGKLEMEGVMAELGSVKAELEGEKRGAKKLAALLGESTAKRDLAITENETLQETVDTLEKERQEHRERVVNMSVELEEADRSVVEGRSKEEELQQIHEENERGSAEKVRTLSERIDALEAKEAEQQQTLEHARSHEETATVRAEQVQTLTEHITTLEAQCSAAKEDAARFRSKEEEVERVRGEQAERIEALEVQCLESQGDVERARGSGASWEDGEFPREAPGTAADRGGVSWYPNP